MEFPSASFRRLAPLVLTCTLALAAAPVSSSECKGSAQEACVAKDQCRWIDEYVRSDGKKVNGYCRSRPKSKQDAGSENRPSAAGGQEEQPG